MATRTKNANTKAALNKCYYAAREYCKSVLKEEEVLNTFRKLYKDACRVESNTNTPLSSVNEAQMEDYLRGLPIGIDCYLSGTIPLVLEWLGVTESEVTGNLDALYWKTLGKVFHDGALTRWGRAFDKTQKESEE